MTTRQLQTMTVPQLRDLSKKAGLPSWQVDGRRLVKKDLVAALARYGRRKPKARKKHTRKPKARKTATRARQRAIPLPKPQPTRDSEIVATLAEQLIAKTLEEMPSDVAINMAMKRILRGGKAVRDRATLQRQRLVAIQLLQRGAPDDRASEFWSAKHAAEMNIAGC